MFRFKNAATAQRFSPKSARRGSLDSGNWKTFRHQGTANPLAWLLRNHDRGQTGQVFSGSNRRQIFVLSPRFCGAVFTTFVTQALMYTTACQTCAKVSFRSSFVATLTSNQEKNDKHAGENQTVQHTNSTIKFLTTLAGDGRANFRFLIIS